MTAAALVGGAAWPGERLTATGTAPAIAGGQAAPWAAAEFDPPRIELVLELVVTCSKPEAVAVETGSKDGDRRSIWPIIGGAFVGRDIRGVVVPGGGDFPLTRPDGVTVVDALYRLRTDDGTTIIIHNKGLGLPGDVPGGRRRYRLSPEFTAPRGKYRLAQQERLHRQPDHRHPRRQASRQGRRSERSPHPRLSPRVRPAAMRRKRGHVRS